MIRALGTYILQKDYEVLLVSHWYQTGPGEETHDGNSSTNTLLSDFHFYFPMMIIVLGLMILLLHLGGYITTPYEPPGAEKM